MLSDVEHKITEVQASIKGEQDYTLPESKTSMYYVHHSISYISYIKGKSLEQVITQSFT
jgi:hypothetical protein